MSPFRIRMRKLLFSNRVQRMVSYTAIRVYVRRKGAFRLARIRSEAGKFTADRFVILKRKLSRRWL